MSVTAHFRGGPLDGTMKMMQECPLEWHFPIAPALVFSEEDEEYPYNSLTFGVAVYRRAPGVVNHEAVYVYEAAA